MKKVIILIGWILLLASVSMGATVPGRWEKVEQLGVGTEILLTFRDGRTEAASFLGSEPEMLIVSRSPGSTPVLVSRGSIERIESAVTVPDSQRNGLLTGGLIGFGAGFLGTAAYNAHLTASGPLWDGEAVAVYLGPAVMGFGAGAATGALIDWAHQEREVFYQVAPRP